MSTQLLLFLLLLIFLRISSIKSLEFEGKSCLEKLTCNSTRRKLIGEDDLHILPKDLISILEFPQDEEKNGSRIILDSKDICLERELNSSEILIEYCSPTCSKESPCLRKCCGPHQLLDMDQFSCVNISSEIFWEAVPDKEETKLKISHTGPPITCPLGTFEFDFRSTNSTTTLQLLPSSSLLISGEEHQESVSWDQFCIDGIKDFNEQNYFKNRVALVCIPPPEDEDSPDILKEYRWGIYPWLTGTSSAFLFLTSVIYLVLWKEQNLPGWLQFSYTNSLLTSFTLLTIVQLYTNHVLEYSAILCKILGYSLHFSFLSSFFFLSSMNFDLWLSFRSSTLPQRRGRKKMRYFMFLSFSTLIPSGVTLIAFASDSGSDIGVRSCALNMHNRMAHLLYFYLVVGILLLINLMFFSCTLLCLRERQRETRFATGREDLIRFRLFTRLFFVMGVLWIFELISWLTHYFMVDERVQRMFVVTDCLNGMQGVGVFFMFLWKPQTWRQLGKRWAKVFNGRSKMIMDERMNSVTGRTTIKSSVKSSGSNPSN